MRLLVHSQGCCADSLCILGGCNRFVMRQRRFQMLQGTIPEVVHAGSQRQQRNSGNEGDFHLVGFISEKMDDPAKISAGCDEKIDY